MIERYTTLFFLSLSVISLIFLCIISAFTYAIRRVNKQTREEVLKETANALYWQLHKKRYPTKIDTLYFSLAIVQQFLRLFYVVCVCFFLFYNWKDTSSNLAIFLRFIEAGCMFFIATLFFAIIGEVLPQFWAYSFTDAVLHRMAPPVLFLLSLFFPLTSLIHSLLRYFFPSSLLPFTESQASSKESLLEMVTNVDSAIVGENEKRLLQSVCNFRDRIVREVMVPRVDLFCLQKNCSIEAAVKQLQHEGYSRVPVYTTSQDNIVGILMYKDILAKYMEYASSKGSSAVLTQPIETIMKPVLYIPETKKIAQLLQEFRKKRTHIAVVVDEYGGTAGIVTIEDILEEIVGEIGDEYDDAESLFSPAGKSGWLVDARMNLLDLEEELNIKIPQEGDYDTISGYIFFRLGMIPKQGTIIHHDDFEIEVVASDDRTVEQVKIVPVHKG